LGYSLVNHNGRQGVYFYSYDVIISPEGNKDVGFMVNVTHEGMKCDEFEEVEKESDSHYPYVKICEISSKYTYGCELNRRASDRYIVLRCSNALIPIFPLYDQFELNTLAEIQ